MATTINAYNVKLSLDASDYIRKSDLSRKETNQLTRAINAARTPVDNYERQVKLVDKALSKGAISQSTYNRLIDDAKGKVDRYNASLRQTNGSMGMMTSRIKSMVAAYAGFATVQKSINLAIQVEQAQAQFEVLTDSAHNAKVLMRDLRDFAARTPVTFSGATDAAKTMLMFNVGVQDVMRNVNMLGAITGGNAERFQSLTLAFSQMTSAGKLMGQDLLQMINAGFNPLQQISLKTGETMMELRKRMETTGISTQEVTQAFVDATSAGGKFDGMTERLAETMGGKMTLAMSELEMAGVKLGEALSPLVITLTSGFSEGIGPLSSIISIIEKMADGFGFLIAVATDAAHAVSLPFAALTGTLDQAGTPHAINDYLDVLDKRDAERAAAKADLGGLEIKEGPAAAVRELGKSAEELKKEAKDAARALKDQERAAAALRKADLSRMQSALENARAHFAAERQMAANRDKQLESTKIASLEVGSADASKFLADQHNRRLANNSRPDPVHENQRQLLTEARKQYAILVAQERQQKAQVAILDKILIEQKENGVRRLR